MRISQSGRVIALTSSLLFASACAASAQGAPDPACKVDLPSFTANAPNIFNDQQEQGLGDALAEYEESDYRIATPTADDQLTKIGEKLLAALPPTAVHYRFRIYESGEVNGFSLAGGHVYISRKLIAAVRNEDELAGVLAHEIGHIFTHQVAIEFTRMFRVRLGVTAVTDRADIFAKVHQLLSTPPKKGEEQETEKEHQLAADHVAVYAMVRAGYATESFASFLNDSMVNKGKTGNWLSDMIGLTHENSLRYRSALKLISMLAPECKGKKAGASDAFVAWQRGIVEEHTKTTAQSTEGDRPVKLDQPLRPMMWRIHFSKDGRYVLGQDEGGITIVDRDAVKVLFRIDAPDAEEAQFTPDGQSVVFHDTDLRVEKWTIATGKREWVKEMVVFDGCNQTRLSPDAKTLVCASLNIGIESGHVRLRLIDVESSQTFFDKPKFFEPPPFWLWMDAFNPSNLAEMLISPDGHFLLVAAGDRTLAFDLNFRIPVAMGGKLKGLTSGRMTFLDSNDLYVVGQAKGDGMNRAQILSFPNGQVLKDTDVGGRWVRSATRGQNLIIGPLKGYDAGVWDPDQHKVVAVTRTAAVDAWDKQVAWESAKGELSLQQLGVPQVTDIPLPLGKLPHPRAGNFSADGRFLVVSLTHRSEIWDLETGKSVGLFRPFRSAWLDGNDHLFAQFPKFHDTDPAELEMTLAPLSTKNLSKFEDEPLQYRDMEIRFKPMGKDKETWHHATLEVKKMETQAVAWTRDYPKETPACWHADDDRLVLAWDLTNDAAKAEMKTYPALQQEASAIKKRGLLLETVVPETGAPLQQVIIPEADLTKGRDDVRRATVSGDYVLARGEHGNTVIYRLANGEKVAEFFGEAVTSDAAAGLVVAVNREDEILVVDEHSGKELKRLTLGSPVRMARIVGEKEKTLLVLTADQTVHRLPMPQQAQVAAVKP